MQFVILRFLSGLWVSCSTSRAQIGELGLNPKSSALGLKWSGYTTASLSRPHTRTCSSQIPQIMSCKCHISKRLKIHLTDFAKAASLYSSRYIQEDRAEHDDKEFYTSNLSHCTQFGATRIKEKNLGLCIRPAARCGFSMSETDRSLIFMP